jgi:hypothetical protein
LTKTLLFIGDGSNLFGGIHPSMWGKGFRAYDKATGKVIWETELPSGTTSGSDDVHRAREAIHRCSHRRQGRAAEWIALGLP